MLPLFDPSLAGTQVGPGNPGQSLYDYIQRSNRPKAAYARVLLSVWLDDLPKEARVTFRHRMIESNDTAFHSVTFELYLFQLFRRCGYSVEPCDCGSAQNAPDFHVRCGNGETEFDLEASLLQPAIPDRLGRGALYKLGREAAGHVNVPGFAVGIDSIDSVAGKEAPSARNLARFLNAWFRSPTELSAQWRYRDWVLSLNLIPLTENQRVNNVFALSETEVYYPYPVEHLRKKISKKCTQFRDHAKPIVLALGVSFLACVDDTDVAQALFADQGKYSGDVPRSPVALVIVHDCYPSALWMARPTLWTHPRNEGALPHWPLRCAGWSESNGLAIRNGTTCSATLLGLSAAPEA